MPDSMIRLTCVCIALTVFAVPSAAQQQTAADTADYRCVMRNVDTLRTANGGGRRNNLANAAQTCATRGFTRNDSVVTPPPPANRPPVAGFAYPVGGCTALEVCTFTSTSTDDKGIASFAWTCASGSPLCSTSTGAQASTVFSVGGNYDVTLTVKDAEGLTSTVTRSVPIAAASIPPDTVTPPDTTTPKPPVDTGAVVAQLPRDTLRDPFPTPVRSVPVPAGTSLQTALNNAQSGDQLVLEQRATYTVDLQWTRCLAGWVTIITGGVDLPEGQRATRADSSRFAKIVGPFATPALLAKNGACKLWLSRVEITSTATQNNALIKIGDGETTLAQQPTDIVLERVYIHGGPNASTQNGVIANGRRVTLKDSWVDQVRWKGVESHCVAGWAGAGPFRLTNNHFDCASIGVLFGGARRSIAGVQPADIEVRGNHFVKDSAYVGYVAKNLFELKDAARVVVENNVIERSWYEAQSAMAVNLQSLSDEGNAAVQTTDVTFRWNNVRAAGQCITMSARGYNGVASPMARVIIEQNLCTNIGVDSINRDVLMTADLQGVLLRHNTFIRNAAPRKNSPTYLQKSTSPQASRVDFVDNVIGPGLDYPCIFGEGKSGTAALANYALAWKFVGNGCFDSHPGASAFPPGNLFLADQASVGFLSDWSLGAQSPWKGKASDGTDPGVDVAELTRRTANVVVP